MLGSAMPTATSDPVKRADPRPGQRQVNVRLPAELFAELLEAAELDHRSVSSAIAAAVQRWTRHVRHQTSEAAHGLADKRAP